MHMDKTVKVFMCEPQKPKLLMFHLHTTDFSVFMHPFYEGL